MSQEIERRAFEIEYREEDSGKVVGLASVYNSRTDIGWFTEEVRDGAFDEADMSDVVWVFNHDNNQLLGRTSSGTVQLKRTMRGLEYEGTLPDTTLGNDMRELLKRGDIKANSFAFSIAKDEWVQERGKPDHRIITKIDKVYDVSLVTNPAYKDAVVFGRSAEEHKPKRPRKRIKRSTLIKRIKF